MTTRAELSSGLVRSPWPVSFDKLISIAQRDLLLVSPFIKLRPIDQIVSNLQERGVDNEIRVTTYEPPTGEPAKRF